MENFEKFVNLYELSKTLRFELIPFSQTKVELEKDWIIEKDREIEEKYHIIKEKLDTLHIKFVWQALEWVDLSLLEEYAELYFACKKDTKNKKLKSKFEKLEKKIRQEITSFFDAEWNKWKEKYGFLKKWWTSFLTEKEILDVLIDIFPENKDDFEIFKWFFTYFSNFNESRKNFYKDEWKAGQIATRAIDENLTTFLENIIKYKNFKKENPDFFTENEEKVFELDFYNFCLTQKWIDNYNEIIWAKSLEEWKNTQGVNQRINLLKQKNEKSNKKNLSYPKFDILYKQILSEKSENDFIPNIENTEELFTVIQKSIKENDKKITEIDKLFKKFFLEENNIDIWKVYISKQAVNTISSKYFENWSSLWWYLWENSKKKYFSLWEIKEALEDIKEKNIFKGEYYNNKIAFENKSNFENFLAIFYYEFQTNLSLLNWNQNNLESLQEKEFKKEEKQVDIIKKYFDSVMDLYAMSKYFFVDLKQAKNFPKDIEFYNDFDLYFSDYEPWKVYNLVRNFLTKKEVKTDKFKLNFSNSQFLTGWDKDKEKERFWVILRKNEKYFLAILKKNNNKIFENYRENNPTDFYEKMEYKQLNNVYRQIPRLGFPLQKKLDSLKWKELEEYLEKYKNNFWYNKEIAFIKEEFDIFQKNKEKWEKFDREKLKKLIDYYKKVVLEKYSDLYDLKKLENTDYDELVNFYDDVEKSMYSLHFTKIETEFLENLEKNWEIYLFQIYNKDFSDYKKENTKENIHTKYFKHLFSEENLENLKIKLSGWAEIFFRDKTHNLKQKLDKNWKKMFYWENKDKKVLEHRRYAKDSYGFHISITLWANNWDMYKFNQFFNKNFTPKHIIGIDRWEKHLAYYSVIDLEGNLVETDTLNIVNGINYLEKLENIEKSRMQERKSWWEIENIKNLKDGYISAVVSKLTELIEKYQAIIVFEDLNLGFKRWREKIERQVYQKLELALAKKLNYLTFKNKKDCEIWGVLNGIQLVPRVKDYQDIANYKQSGIIFYTNPAYTSTTCPECGWRKTLKFPSKITKTSILEFFKEIQMSFYWEKFSFTYENILWKSETLFSNVKRTQWNNKSRKIEHKENITQELKSVFEKYNINLWENISEKLQQTDMLLEDLKVLFYNFKLINNIRNSDSKLEEDIISCPCCLFNSENWFKGAYFNGDANGAYNTARKGIIMLENIKVNPERSNLFVRNEEWDEFLREEF